MGGKRGSSQWSPLSLGPLAWYRSDLGVTVATGVSEWQDQSGNGHHLVQAVGANQPAYSASDADFGGKPSVTFDGVNDALNEAAYNLILPTGAATILLVATKLSAAGQAFYALDQASTQYEHFVREDRIISHRAGNTSTYTIDATISSLSAGAKTFVQRVDSSHATHKFRVNGADVAITSVSAGDPAGVSGSARVELGNYAGGSMANCKMAEFVVIGSYSEATVALLETYARSRYGHY
jgi:hypothetical protein